MHETDIDLRGLLGLLHRQVRLILGTIFVIVALAAIVVFSLTPIYTASALILVDPSSKNLLDPQAEITGAASDNARLDSEVEILRSESVLLELARSNNLVSDSEFGVKLGTVSSVLAFLHLKDPDLPTGSDALQEVLGNISRAVSIQRRGLTYLLSVQVSSKYPEKAAQLANALASSYIQDQVNSKIGSTLAVRDILQAQIADATAAVVASEQAFDSFVDQNIQRISVETGRTDIADLRLRLDRANSQRAESALLVDLVERDVASGRWEAVASSLRSDALTELEEQRQALQSNLVDAVQNSPRSVDLQAELSAIEGRMGEVSRTALTQLRDAVAAAQGQASGLREQLRSAVLSSDLPADVLAAIYELQQSSEIARSQYQTLLSRLRDVEQQAKLQIADSRVVSPALAPAKPSFPNPTLLLSLAGITATLLGIGLAFLYENYIGGFTSEGQVASVLKTPVAASIPRHRTGGRGGNGDGDTVANMLITAPLSIYAESVRRVRAGIDHAIRTRRNANAPDPRRSRVLMVSSAAPNEGKTTLALSLARAYALSGERTLLIDCDLRKPGVHRQLGLAPSSGLLQYLTGVKSAETLAGILFNEADTGLSVLVGSRRSDIPTDQIVSSKALADLIQLASESFDVIVIDTPPVGPVVDALYLAPFADTIAFVVRWSSTSQQDARQAVQALEAAKRPTTDILTVLNQQEGSYGSLKSKYAGYYDEAY